MSAQKDCTTRCQKGNGGEVKHFRSCKYYPGSFSEKLDTAREQLLKAEEVIRKATEAYSIGHEAHTYFKDKDREAGLI